MLSSCKPCAQAPHSPPASRLTPHLIRPIVPTRFPDRLVHTVQSLTGAVIYHDAPRQWIELRLDKAACDRESIQLVVVGDTAAENRRWKKLQSIRGCSATVTGPLEIAGTGYFSAEIYQTAAAVAPASTWPLRQPPHVRFGTPCPTTRTSNLVLTFGRIGARSPSATSGKAQSWETRDTPATTLYPGRPTCITTSREVMAYTVIVRTASI
jgi:hypothetical protein